MKPFQNGNKVNKPVTLTVTFDLHFWKKNLHSNFWIIGTKGGIVFISYMCIPCDEAFLCILMKPFQNGNKVNKLVTFDLHVSKFFDLCYNFWIIRVRGLTFHMFILCDDTFPWMPNISTLG